MLRRLRDVGLAAAVILAARDAAASPAFPPPLERIVHEATLIVTGRLKTNPVHVGDVYELEVDETLKGVLLRFLDHAARTPGVEFVAAERLFDAR